MHAVLTRYPRFGIVHNTLAEGLKLIEEGIVLNYGVVLIPGMAEIVTLDTTSVLVEDNLWRL
ncbi:hypothetical protein DRQ00_12275 [candidate division KSB1 bacterium]|nr:MAG: hypothetical protein DRQ00_12275 [candidate division KSB1 bacterium]